MEYEEARQWDAKEQRDKQLQAVYIIGKKEELKVTAYLTGLGFTITNISEEIMPDGSWSPFDLLATKGNISYVMDVKRQGIQNSDFWFKDKTLKAWEAYNTTAIKLVVFTTFLRNIWVCKYATIPTLRLLSFHKRSINTHHIKFKDTRDIIDIDIWRK